MNPGERSLYNLIERENLLDALVCIASGADFSENMKLLHACIGNESTINLIVEINDARLTFDFICVSEWINEYEMQRLISVVVQSKNLQMVCSLTCMSHRFSDLTLSRLIDVIVEMNNAGEACTFACEANIHLSLEQRDALMKVVTQSGDPMLAAEFATSIKEDLFEFGISANAYVALNELFLIILQSGNRDAALMFIKDVKRASAFQKSALRQCFKRTHIIPESEHYASIIYSYE